MFEPIKWYHKIAQIIKEHNPEIDTSIGTMVGDVVIVPMCIIREILDKAHVYNTALYSLDKLLELLADPGKINDIAVALDVTPYEVTMSLKNVLDNIAKDYGLTRYGIKEASGIVHYIPKTFGVGVYVVSPADKVKSVYNLIYEPTTSQVFTVTQENMDTFYVPQLGTHAFPVLVKCTTPGKVGNVAPYQINYDFGYYLPTNWERAVNIVPITNGRDEETDQELVKRIKSKWKGSNLATINGYRNLLAEYNITDCYLAGPGDQYQYRAYSGVLDIYLRPRFLLTIDIVVSLPESLSPNSTKTFLLKDLAPEYMYIDRVIPLNTEITAVIEKDNSLAFRRSSIANDKIIITNNSLSTIQIVALRISYDPDVAAIQRVVNMPENKILGLDVVARQALPKEFSVQCSIVPKVGYLPSTVKSAVETAIKKYVDSLPLGSKVATSDLVNVVEDVEGVDIVTSLSLACETPCEIVIASKIEYLKATSVIVNI